MITRKNIEMIIKNTPKELKGKQVKLTSVLGYRQPLLETWYYTIGYTEFKNINVLVVLKQGKVV